MAVIVVAGLCAACGGAVQGAPSASWRAGATSSASTSPSRAGGSAGTIVSGIDPAVSSSSKTSGSSRGGVATTTADGPRCRVAGLPLESVVARTLMLGVGGSSSQGTFRDLTTGLRAVGGVLMDGSSNRVLTDGSVKRLTRLPGSVLVAADEEGGRVQRIDHLVGSWPSARQQARAMSPDQVRHAAARRGAELMRLGITMALAPVVDLGGQPDGAVIGDRSFAATATDVKGVVAYAGATVEGLRSAGVLPTLKHFPGHGRAHGDSHLGSVVTPPFRSLRMLDVEPYRRLAHAGKVAVMVGHLVVPGLTTSGRPASLDPAVYALLHGELGFDGLAVTDELGAMRAVHDRYGPVEAAVRAIAAGADLALIADGTQRDRLVNGLVAAVEAGRLSRARVREAAGRVAIASGCKAVR